MNFKRLIKTSILFLYTLLSLPLYAQQQNLTRLEKQVRYAVMKARPACVYLNDYDPKSKTLMGNRFSGVVVSADGLILTVAHASFPGMTYMVTFPDGKEFLAKGVGRIAAIDASVLKIEQQGKWPFAEMGWSSLLKVNQPCISIAYPASFDNNRLVVRFGYVAEVSSTQKANSIRTTCIMEPGDSGGPTFDLKGRVVGLHSSATASVECNFEVPVDLYRKYWNALQQINDYDGLPIGEQLIPDSLGYAKKLSFNNVDQVMPGLLKAEAAVNNTVLKVTSMLDGKATLINGTLVDLTGIAPVKQAYGKSYVISKNSMVGDKPVVDIGNGKTIMARIIARNDNRDLILLELPVQLPKGIAIINARTDTVNLKELGKFLISPQQGAEAKKGVIATTTFDLPMKYRAGYSGAGTVAKDGKVMINMVQNNSAGSDAGLKPGDEVLSINNVRVITPDEYIFEMRKNMPGDMVTLVRQSGEKRDTVKLTLKKYPVIRSEHPAEKFAGGKSEVRDGFKAVFVQDGNIMPIQCGGPVFDIAHKFAGINIARFSRTSTLIISPQQLNSFIQQCVNDGCFEQLHN